MVVGVLVIVAFMLIFVALALLGYTEVPDTIGRLVVRDEHPDTITVLETRMRPLREWPGLPEWKGHK